MPFGQPVLDTVRTQPNGTTKLSNNKTLEKKKKKKKKKGGGGGEQTTKKKITKREPDGSS